MSEEQSQRTPRTPEEIQRNNQNGGLTIGLGWRPGSGSAAARAAATGK